MLYSVIGGRRKRSTRKQIVSAATALAF